MYNHGKTQELWSRNEEGLETAVDRAMKNEPKLRETDRSADEVIGAIDHPGKQADARVLLDIFSSITGHPPKVWAEKQIGFGKVRFHTKSGREGDMYITGFAVNARRITLYLHLDSAIQQERLKQLGKATAGKVCVYVNKLADINVDVLKEMIIETVRYSLETFSASDGGDVWNS